MNNALTGAVSRFHLTIWVMQRESRVKPLSPQENIQMGTTWQELSREFTKVINDVGKSIVAVDGRSGHTSSGIVWRTDTVLTAAHSIRQESGIRVYSRAGNCPLRRDSPVWIEAPISPC